MAAHVMLPWLLTNAQGMQDMLSGLSLCFLNLTTPIPFNGLLPSCHTQGSLLLHAHIAQPS